MTAPGPGRFMPAVFIAAGVLLALIGAAILLQAPGGMPMAPESSPLTRPTITPDIPGTVTIGITPGSPVSPGTAGNSTGIGQTVETRDLPGQREPGDVAEPVIPQLPVRTGTGDRPGIRALNTTLLEVRVHEEINRVRQEHGLPALGTDPALASLARAHSTDMALHRYFGHVNLDERDATARGAAAGYVCHKDADPYYSFAIAENLYATSLYSTELIDRNGTAVLIWNTENAIAAETVDGWMNSPDHRENVLDPGMGREGIGVALAEYELVFITEDFC